VQGCFPIQRLVRFCLTPPINRITADESFVKQIQSRMHPGMVMIVTDLPLHPDSRSGKDFVIMTAGV